MLKQLLIKKREVLGRFLSCLNIFSRTGDDECKGGRPQLLKGLNISTFFSLARLHVYGPICFFSTILGLDVIGKLHDLWSLFIIGTANTFALIATFAFNDAEDAPDDAHAGKTKNVVASGKISKEAGYLTAVAAAAISVSLAAYAGIIVCLVILSVLATTFLYSWRRVRLKGRPFWDVIVHAVTGGLLFLAAAWSSNDGIIWGNRVLPVFMVFALGNTVAVLVHGLFEYEKDLDAGIRTSVTALGKKASLWIVSIVFSVFTVFILNEYRMGTFPLLSIVSFFIVAGTLMLLSIFLFSKISTLTPERMVPWAVNSGAVSAFVVWYFFK